MGAGAVALPLTGIFCVDPGIPPLLSVNVTFAVRVPTAKGTKDTCTVQVCPAGKTAGGTGHVLVSLNSAEFVPVKAMELMVKTAVPVLLTVMACAALEVVINWVAKVRLPGFRPIAGSGVPAVVTVRLVVPEIFPEVARITEVPAATLVASPAALIVAVAGVAEDHVTLPVRFCMEPLLNVPVAVNC